MSTLIYISQYPLDGREIRNKIYHDNFRFNLQHHPYQTALEYISRSKEILFNIEEYNTIDHDHFEDE